MEVSAVAMQVTYPLRVEAELQPDLSRWLWLVKWFLAIPHFVVLTFLWLASAALTVVAFFAIVVTGRYPRTIFDFNVGVLRWSWRVADYAFGVLATDRYPPFTLAETTDYPAHLDVSYPARLSRWLPFVKWILAIPHLIIVAVLAGGGTWVAWNVGRASYAVWGNLIGLLVVIAAVMLAVTGSYPRPLFDLILGLQRWVLRVAAYLGFMTDRYPPFRLDMGGEDPGGTLTATPPDAGGGPSPTPPRRSRWTGGRITSVVVGSLVGTIALGLLAGGGVLTWLTWQRDAGGFVTVEERRFSTEAVALTATAEVTRDGGTGWLGIRGQGWFLGGDAMKAIRLRVHPANPGEEMFVGIGRADLVASYLDGVAVARIRDFDPPGYETTAGDATPAPPEDQPFWVASNAATGSEQVLWHPHEGSWTVVVMGADGAPGVDVRADVGARIPLLPAVTVGLLVGGFLTLVVATFLVAVPIRRATTSEWEELR